MLDVWFKSFLSGIMVLAPIILVTAMPLTYSFHSKAKASGLVAILFLFECLFLLCFAVSTLGFTVVSIIILLHRIWG